MRLLIACLLLVSTRLFAADATLEIIKEARSSLNVAVESKSRTRSQMDVKIGKMIEADLKTAGFYNVLPSPEGAGANVAFDSPIYQNAGLHQLIRYELFYEGTQVGIRVQVYDIKSKKLLFSQPYKVSREDRYVFLSHHFVMDLANKMGVGGLEWMNRFVLLSRQTSPKQTEIMIADYSLTYRQTIVRGGFNVFPKWADSKQTSYYYTHYDKKPTLYKVDLKTGAKTKIIDSEGMLVCSDVSKDGKKLLLTMARDDQPDVFEFDVSAKKLRRLTNFRGIDVNGHYIDDEGAFVFVTDRLGYPEIFYASMKNPEAAMQYVFKGRNNNYVTTWKHYAVFVSRDTDSEFAQNTFNLYLVSTKSNYIRQLTTTGKNNFPRFSNSGDTILHTKEIRRGKESALAIIRLPYNKSFLFPLEGSIQAIDW
ncbi:MAG: Tol-Pal system protein TolB [Helicobacteraceae bacterium]|nr:Tol-Pal system protein TolB [Helicobacteraceae bacterium]